MSPADQLKEGDFVGVGVNCHRNVFLVVKNGKVVSHNIHVPSQWTEFFPAVGVNNDGEKVQLTFSPKEFKFDYIQSLRQIESEIEADIKKEEVNSSQIYPLVY